MHNGAWPVPLSNEKAPTDWPGLSTFCERAEGLFSLFLLDLFAAFLINHLHGQTDLAAIVKAQQFDPDFLTFAQNIGRMVQAAVLDLADVHQTIALAKEVHEGAEIDDLHDLAFVNRAFFRLGHNRVDHVIGFLDRLAVRAGDLDDAIVIDIDLGARHFNDFTDDLAARADHFADLVGSVDSEGLGALDEDSNHDVRIFSLAILMSSYFLYNSVGSIDENALQNLSLVINLTKHIHIKSHSCNEDLDPEEYAPYFPSFMWVVRDFALQLVDSEGEQLTSKEYLEKAL